VTRGLPSVLEPQENRTGFPRVLEPQENRAGLPRVLEPQENRAGLPRVLEPGGEADEVRPWLHGQTELGSEVQLLAGDVLDAQAVEQRRQEHKHLQPGEAVSKATPLPHAEDEDLLRQLFVETPREVQEAFGAEGIWVAPKISGDQDRGRV